jgi:7-cyano-7-deazaguanine synthase
VVLLSGGLDSTTTLAIAKDLGHQPHAISFRYGQRHAIELDAAQAIAAKRAWTGTRSSTSTCACSAVRH